MICQSSTIHKQVILNILIFEALGLTFINSPISNSDLTTPRQVILSLTCVSEESKEEKIFALTEKDKNANAILFCRKKFYYDVTTIAKYLVALMIK